MTRGRPRDPALDGRIREAALDLFLEHGIDGSTMDEVAARAGVGKASVYRRWQTKEDLVVEALEQVLGAEVPIPDSGSLRDDLALVWRDLLRFLHTTRGATMFGLVHSTSGSGDGMMRVRRQLCDRQQQIAARSLAHARERGELRADVTDETIINLIIGLTMARLMLGRPAHDLTEVPELVELVLHGVAEP